MGVFLSLRAPSGAGRLGVEGRCRRVLPGPLVVSATCGAKVELCSQETRLKDEDAWGVWLDGIVCLGTSGAGSQHSRSRLPLVYSYPGFRVVPLTSIPTLRTPRPPRPGMLSGVTCVANLHCTTTTTTWLIIASLVNSCTDAYFYSNRL